MYSSAFNVTGNQAIDFRLPVQRVAVHVQDPQGNPVAGAGLSSSIVSNCELPFGPVIACGLSNYTFQGGAAGVTDAFGNGALWLFSTPPPQADPTVPTTYRITATPPSGSGFAAASISPAAFARAGKA